MATWWRVVGTASWGCGPAKRKGRYRHPGAGWLLFSFRFRRPPPCCRLCPVPVLRPLLYSESCTYKPLAKQCSLTRGCAWSYSNARCVMPQTRTWWCQASHISPCHQGYMPELGWGCSNALRKVRSPTRIHVNWRQPGHPPLEPAPGMAVKDNRSAGPGKPPR
jgi:hypothetical protein